MIKQRKISVWTATAIVVANMVGTGVFTSLGFQLLDFPEQTAPLLLWLVGGVIALCGALTYAELAIRFPGSGGEYHFLSKGIHPSIGFMAGWISSTVGFAAPAALAAMALGKYVNVLYPQIPPLLPGVLVVVLLAFVHSINLKMSSQVQVISTAAKVLLIVIFILAGFFSPENAHNLKGSIGHIFEKPGAWGTSLLYVSFAYSGWNAAAYLASEIEIPEKNLPKALIGGTSLVILLYLCLNFVFLKTTPISLMVGKVEVGYEAAMVIFGPLGGSIMAGIISILLISTISAMTLAGPRVLWAMGTQYPKLKLIGKLSSRDLPVNAIITQTCITLILILSGSFKSLLTYASFTLEIFTILAVSVLVYDRWKRPKLLNSGYRIPLYPLPSILFLVLCIASLVMLSPSNPTEVIAGLLTCLAALPAWWWLKK